MSDCHDEYAFRIRLWHFPPTSTYCDFFRIWTYLWTEPPLTLTGLACASQCGCGSRHFCIGLGVAGGHRMGRDGQRVPRAIHDPWDFRFSRRIVCADLTRLSKNDRNVSIHQISPTRQELTLQGFVENLGRHHRSDKISMTRFAVI